MQIIRVRKYFYKNPFFTTSLAITFSLFLFVQTSGGVEDRKKINIVKTIDGNTVLIKEESETKIVSSVQLRCIKAPRLNEPGGKQSKEFLEVLLQENGDVFIEKEAVYIGKETFLFLSTEQESIGKKLVRNGFARASISRCFFGDRESRSEYDTYEEEQAYAEVNKNGLWGQNLFIH